MTRKAYVLHDHRLVIFWTPKAACTSIVDHIVDDVLQVETWQVDMQRYYRRRWFRGLASDILTSTGIRRKRRKNMSRRAWLRINGYEIDSPTALVLMQKGYKSIALIREPYNRLVSAYWSKFVFRTGGNHGIRRLEDLEEFAYKFYLNWYETVHSSQPKMYYGISFQDFVTFVCDTIDTHNNPDAVLNNHWNTQIPASFEETDVNYDEIFEAKNAKHFFERIGALTKTNLAAKNSNATAVRSSLSSGPSLISKNSLSLIDLPGYAPVQFENSKLRSRVANSFARDYKYYGVAKQHAKA